MLSSKTLADSDISYSIHIDINIHRIPPRKDLFKLNTDRPAKGNKSTRGIIRNQKGVWGHGYYESDSN